MHAWLHVAGSSHDTANGHELANVLGSHIAHLRDVLLAEFTWHKNRLVVALQLSGNARNGVRISACVFSSDQTLLHLDLTRELQVESSLLHYHVVTRHVLVTEVQTRLGHVCVDHFVEQLDVGRRIAQDALHVALVTLCTVQRSQRKD